MACRNRRATDPYGRWCGGRELKSPAYPIRGLYFFGIFHGGKNCERLICIVHKSLPTASPTNQCNTFTAVLWWFRIDTPSFSLPLQIKLSTMWTSKSLCSAAPLFHLLSIFSYELHDNKSDKTHSNGD